MKSSAPRIEFHRSSPFSQADRRDFGSKRHVHPLVLVVVGLVLWGAGVAPANDLSNGFLDLTSISSQILATPTDWTVFASRPMAGEVFGGSSSEGFANVQQSGGQGFFFKAFQGSAADPLTVNFYQDKPATPGRLYTL